MSKELSPVVRAIADALVDGANISPEGNATFGTDYATQLTEHTGHTMEMVKAQQTFDAQYAAAVHVAQGELAIPFFKENEDVKMVTSKQTCGLDRLAVRTHHSKSYPVPGSDKVVTNYCQTSVIYDKYSGTFAKEAKLHVQSRANDLLK